MSRGGFRQGAGRPRKGEVSASKEIEDAVEEAESEGQSPLEYMLKVMNDPAADKVRRDRMAMAAAPFVHGKPSEAAQGKKEQKQAAAESAATSGSKFAPPIAPKLVVDNR